MSQLFLVNPAIDLQDFIEFKNGMQDLMAIEKIENDIFYKNEQIYNVKIFNDLYSNFGYVEQEISRFIEQDLLSCDKIVENEITAKEFCNSNNFAFLGINFMNSNLSVNLQITDKVKYISWIESKLSNFEIFKNIVKQSVYNKSFESAFNSLSEEIQLAIIEKLRILESRNLDSIFSPGFQLLKNVTQDNFKFSVQEFRLSSPVALRIYFSEIKGKVYFGSIESKSNANQTKDIKNAYEIIKKLIE
jgi:hypothetical protein